MMGSSSWAQRAVGRLAERDGAERQPEVDLSVIVPMFNEEANVAETVARVRAALEPYEGRYEILLVDDGSVDGTLLAAGSVAADDERVRVVGYRRNRGRGKALRTGFAAARGAVVASIDADLSYDPKYILDLVKTIDDNEDVDIAVASPYMTGGGTEGVPRNRLWVSRGGNWLLSQAMGGNIKTITCIVRAYRREVLESLELESDGKEIHLEILSKALALGYRVREVPAILRSRKRGKSKFRLRSTAFTHLVFTVFERPLILFGAMGLLFTLFGLAGGAYILYLWQQQALNPERPLMTLMVLLILAGVQVASFGLIGTQLVLMRKEIYKIQRANGAVLRAVSGMAERTESQMLAHPRGGEDEADALVARRSRA